MIVEKIERPVVTSVDLKSNQYRIDVSGLPQVLSILRKGMYSTPKRIIVQEYANNARDAHVAAGIPDEPIKIYCPDHANPYLKIQDFGLGLSPDDIQEVFIQYGASTKRNTNEQIGSFGLGAKSAFAYTDSFEVETINGGMKYNYVAYIDKSEIGEMPLVSSVETDEHSGTTITIPIREEDIYEVNKWIAKITEYWKIRPIVVGHVAWANRKIYFGSDNWQLAQTSLDWQAEKMLFCLEGIPYYFSLNSQHVPDDLLKFTKCPFIVHLRTGEVTINANRESLVEDEKTIKTIRKTLESIQKEFKNHVLESFQKCDRLNEVFKLRQSFETMGVRDMIGVIDWKGLKIESNSLRIPSTVGDVYYCSAKARNNGLTVKLGSPNRDIDFTKESGNHIFLSYDPGYDSIRKLRVRNAMLKNDIRSCQVIWLKNAIDVNALQQYGFSYFDWEDLSKYENKNFDRTNNVGSKVEPTYVWQLNGYSFEKTTFDPENLNNGYYIAVERGCSVNDHALADIRKHYGINIWGIPNRFLKYIEDNDDVPHISEYVQNIYNETKKYLEDHINDVLRYCVYDYNCKEFYTKLDCKAIADRINDDNHPFKKWVNSSQSNITAAEINTLKKQHEIHNACARILGKEIYEVPAEYLEAKNETIAKFPMLKIISQGLCNFSIKSNQLKEINDSIVDYLLFAGKPAEAENLEPF